MQAVFPAVKQLDTRLENRAKTILLRLGFSKLGLMCYLNFAVMISLGMHRQVGPSDMALSACLKRIGTTNSVVGTRSGSVHF